MVWQDDFLEKAIDYHKKYAFFILSLIFTVLGFSIQTADFNQILICNLFELSAWISLLFSGIYALKGINGLIELFNFLANSNEKNKEGSKEKFQDYNENNRKFSRKKYFFFLLGFILLIISRGVIPVTIKIIHSF